MSQLSSTRPLQTTESLTAVHSILNDVNLYYSLQNFRLLFYGTEAIDNMIDNILFTTPGERHYEPLFGSGILYLLWEPIDPVTAWKMETASYDALKIWMPYIDVKLNKSKIEPMKDGQQGYDIKIEYIDRIHKQPGVYYQQVLAGV